MDSRLLILLALPLALAGQTFGVTPRSVSQGEVIRVFATGKETAARMGPRTIRLFAQPAGTRMGLMPVGPDETPGERTIDFLDGGGAVLHRESVSVRDAHFPEQNIVLGKEKASLESSPEEIRILHAFRDTVTDKRLWSEPLAPPLGGCVISPFGMKRLYNGKPAGYYHSGLDQRSPAGRPVRAVAAGTVRLVGRFALLGRTVGIDHGQGLSSMYLHMSRFAVKEGAVVRKGQIVGYVGSTGRATGPHLHWTLYANGVAVNPLQWMSLARCGK